MKTSITPPASPIRILKAFYSFKVILPIIFFYALSCAIATFIENDYGANAAYTIIYGSWWFMLLHIYLAIALLASFIHSCAYKRKKYASMLLHSSFIVIIIGAGITRYFGTEGMMWIQEGKSASFYYSNDNYINIAALNDSWQKDYAQIPANISAFRGIFTNSRIKDSAMIFDKPVEVLSQEVALIPNKSPRNAPMLLRLLVSYNGQTKPIELIGGNGFSNEHAAVREEIGGMKMSFHWGSRRVELPFSLRLLQFEKKTYAGTDNPSSYASEVEILDAQGSLIKPFRIFMNNVLDFGGYRFYQSDYFFNEEAGNYTSVLSVNHDPGKLPTYIGYAMLIIGALWLLFDKNGRFMQLARFVSSHNLAQKGVLALVLALGLLYTPPLHANTPNIQTHGKQGTPLVETGAAQNADSNKVDSKAEQKVDSSKVDSSAAQTSLPDNLMQFLTTSNHLSSEQIESFKRVWEDLRKDPDSIDPAHRQERIALLRDNAREFATRLSRIQIQDYAGRIQPFDTMAMHIMHKISRTNGFEGLDNTQTLMGAMIFPSDFVSANLIHTKTPKLRAILGVPQDKVRVSFMDIYDTQTGESKLHNYFADVQHKSESEWNAFDKDVRKVTESYEIVKSVQTLLYLRIFPDPSTKRWFSATELTYLLLQGQLPMQEYEPMIQKVDSMMNALFMGMILGVSTNSWDLGISALKSLESYQEQNGGEDYVSPSRIEWEIALNHYNIFETLILPYTLLGLLGLLIVLVYIYKDRAVPRRVYRVFFALIALCVIAHTLGLIVRWYVSGHSPWSNAYESMIYIAWASGIAGVLCFPRFMLALCATSFFSGASLFVAHLGYMDPQIQDLVPVLQSYWLNIHVSVITASYGFLGLCFVLGAFTLVLFILRKPDKAHIDKAIISVNAINEMTMILGIFMLTIGNFLGAIWANESWGRYWGWDPKETWALIAIGIYAIVLHLRFIKFSNLPFVFATGSVLAFYSVLMTYFGVNYYLAGKHSYAGGDPVPMPWEMYVFIAITLVLIIIASFKKTLPAPNVAGNGAS